MPEAEHITRGLHGRWHGLSGIASYPAHDDRRPSLSLADAPDGRLLLHCFAGCTFAAVMAALRSLGLVEGTGPELPSDPAELARQRAVEEADAAKREAQAFPLASTTISPSWCSEALHRPTAPNGLGDHLLATASASGLNCVLASRGERRADRVAASAGRGRDRARTRG